LAGTARCARVWALSQFCPLGLLRSPSPASQLVWLDLKGGGGTKPAS